MIPEMTKLDFTRDLHNLMTNSLELFATLNDPVCLYHSQVILESFTQVALSYGYDVSTSTSDLSAGKV